MVREIFNTKKVREFHDFGFVCGGLFVHFKRSKMLILFSLDTI